MLAAPEDVSVICLFLSWFNASTSLNCLFIYFRFCVCPFPQKDYIFQKKLEGADCYLISHSFFENLFVRYLVFSFGTKIDLSTL